MFSGSFADKIKEKQFRKECITMVEGIGFGRNAYETTYSPAAQIGRTAQVGVNQTEETKKAEEESRLPGSKKVKPSECMTCKNRKYVDGSDEGNVSFKAPGHISPKSSAAMVSAHEQQHVANARREGSKDNAKLMSASVTLKLAVCPECGTSYVAGGVTSTTIKYSEENPYERNRKQIEGDALRGINVDERV